MSTATLMFNLLAGTVGAVAVWLAVRALCARLAGRGKTPASGPARTGGRADTKPSHASTAACLRGGWAACCSAWRLSARGWPEPTGL